MSRSGEIIDQFEADHSLITATLEAVDLSEHDGYELPSFDEVVSLISDTESVFFAEQAKDGAVGKLVIAPYLGCLTLDRFLVKTGHGIASESTFTGSPLGDRLTRDPAAHNRSKGASGWSVGVVLGETHDRKGAELPATGLVYSGKSFERQRMLAKVESLKLALRGVNAQPISVQEQIIAKLAYPELGEGTTRFVHLPTPNIFHAARGRGPGLLGMALSIGGHPGAPELNGDKLYVGTSTFHKKDQTAGVRRVVALK